MLPGLAMAQIPVELFVGHERATVDIMFFRFFQNAEGQSSPWLFFNRNRASIDLDMSNGQPALLFGFTEAVSYNAPKLKGFAPVVVGQVLSWGVFPKAGIQFAKITAHATLFTWAVAELESDPRLDHFLLARWTPALGEKWNGFLQAEALTEIPTDSAQSYGFTQRFRLGFSRQGWQFGGGIDLSQSGRDEFTNTQNYGLFLRHEF